MVEAALKERRQIPRWDIGIKAQVKPQGKIGFLSCQIKDLNFRGFRIILASQLEDNCRALAIHFAEDFIFNVEVDIVWHALINGQNTYGVKFTRVRDDDKERLYQFVFQNFPSVIERNIKG